MQTHPLSIQASSEIPSKWDRQIEAAKRFFGIKPRPVVPTNPALTPKQSADKFLEAFNKNEEAIHRSMQQYEPLYGVSTSKKIFTVPLSSVTPLESSSAEVEGSVLRALCYGTKILTNMIPEGESAADYAKRISAQAAAKKNVAAHLDLATLSKPTPKTVKGFILDYLEQQDGPVSAFEIYEGIFYPGVIKYGTVTTRISELAKSGQITYTGKITRNGKQVNGYVAAGVK